MNTNDDRGSSCRVSSRAYGTDQAWSLALRRPFVLDTLSSNPRSYLIVVSDYVPLLTHFRDDKRNTFSSESEYMLLNETCLLLSKCADETFHLNRAAF